MTIATRRTFLAGLSAGAVSTAAGHPRALLLALHGHRGTGRRTSGRVRHDWSPPLPEISAFVAARFA